MKKKFSFIFYFILFSSFFVFPHVEADISFCLDKKDKHSLTEFFHAMLWGSEVGYVLYGEKPVCIESYGEDYIDRTGTLMHHLTTSIREGVRVWKKHAFPNESSKFLFLIKENPDINHYSIIFINKAAFYKAFSKNSSLFRYIFGPEITASKFLKELKVTKKDFFTFLNDDKVLIGILLGFGFENALYVSRTETIDEALEREKKQKHPSNFVFPSNKGEKVIPPFRSYPIQPSLGYFSLEQELNALDKKRVSASSSLENYSPKLTFGKVIHKNHLPNSSDKLAKHYEDVQLKLIKVLDSPQWLEDFLSHFYEEPTKISIRDDEQKDLLKNYGVIELSQAVATAILNRFEDEFKEKNKVLDFIEGMKEAQKRADAHYIFSFLEKEIFPKEVSDDFLHGFNIWRFYKFNKEISLPLVINHLQRKDNKGPLALSILLPLIHKQIFENINENENNLALFHFQQLGKTKCIDKNRLFYQRINSGKGKEVLDSQFVKLSYNLKTIYGNLLEDKKNVILDLSRAMRAFRVIFPSMRVGEKGVLYIHPEYGIKDYRSVPFFSPYLISEFTIHDVAN